MQVKCGYLRFVIKEQWKLKEKNPNLNPNHLSDVYGRGQGISLRATKIKNKKGIKFTPYYFLLKASLNIDPVEVITVRSS